MKVRYRGTIAADMHEVIDESPNFYIVKGVDGHCSLSKRNYEPVPTERWVDVTEKCGHARRAKGYDVFYNGAKINWDICRLRKVRLDDSTYDEGFIIEKKESV